jgi:hypothetical protein
VFVTVLREAFLANPKASAAVKRQLARAGMKAPSEYSLTFPELEPPAMQPLNGEFPGGTPECGAPQAPHPRRQGEGHRRGRRFRERHRVLLRDLRVGGRRRAAASRRRRRTSTKAKSRPSRSSPASCGASRARAPPAATCCSPTTASRPTPTTATRTCSTPSRAARKRSGGVAGDNGWIFTGVGAAAPILSQALALDGDDHLFNATQIIPLEKQLDLTNGRFWNVSRKGTHINSDWEWSLRIEGLGLRAVRHALIVVPAPPRAARRARGRARSHPTVHSMKGRRASAIVGARPASARRTLTTSKQALTYSPWPSYAGAPRFDRSS